MARMVAGVAVTTSEAEGAVVLARMVEDAVAEE